MSRVMMVISGTAQPGHRDQVHELFRSHLAGRATANTGQPLVIWAADDGDSDRFHLVEVYDDPAVVEANSQAEWFWAYMAEVGPLLASEPTVTTATPRWAKGLPPE